MLCTVLRYYTAVLITTLACYAMHSDAVIKY